MNYLDVNILENKVITNIDHDSEQMTFTCDDGKKYMMYHRQDCCESVSIEDIVGDINDLLNTPILKAEEVTSDENPSNTDKSEDYQESFTWTYYKFATIKGYVDIRWYGESNGYYSESVDFVEI